MIEKIIRGIFNFIRIVFIKIRCGSKVCMSLIQPMRINSQLMVQSKVSEVIIGKHLKLENHAIIRVIDGGTLNIGNNCFVNCNSFITVLGKTTIGNNCMIGPGVMIFDHDHDFRSPGGIKSGKMKIGEVEIGDNVWIGANCVILKGAKIHDNCVIGAGSIINSEINEGSVCVQKRNSDIFKISK